MISTVECGFQAQARKMSGVLKLELAVNEHRRQRKQQPLIDYSDLSDEDLNSLFKDEIVKIMAEPSPYAGMTDGQLSDIYMQHIQEGNRKNAKKLK